MVEGARLESVYTARYQGFESLSLRHISTSNRVIQTNHVGWTCAASPTTNPESPNGK